MSAERLTARPSVWPVNQLKKLRIDTFFLLEKLKNAATDFLSQTAALSG